MIDWLLNDVLWGWGQRGFIFYRGFLGDRARLLQCLCHTYLEVLDKMVAQLIVVCNNLQEGYGHYTDQNMPFKR